MVAGCDNDPYATLTYLHNLGRKDVKIHYVEPDDEAKLEKAGKKCFPSPKYRDWRDALGENLHNLGPDYPGIRHFWFGDIRKIRGEDMLNALGMEPGEVDCVVGGPPCQGFSHLQGKRDVMDPRNSLVFEFARLVLEIRPKMMVMENVPGILDMVTPEGIPVVDALCRVLEDGGFGCYEALKRSLLVSSGAGAALRTGPRETKEKNSPDNVGGLKQAVLF